MDARAYGFEAFLKTFPRSELADDAQFYIGETLLRAERWTDGGRRLQSRSSSNYPMGNAVPERTTSAGWRRSASDSSTPRAIASNTSIKTFPDSDAGRLAKQKLDQLARRPTP